MVTQSTMKCSWTHRVPSCVLGTQNYPDVLWWSHRVPWSVLGRTEFLVVLGTQNYPDVLWWSHRVPWSVLGRTEFLVVFWVHKITQMCVMVAQSTIKCSWAHRSPICGWVHEITLESVIGRTKVLFVVGYTKLPLTVFLDAQKSYLWLGTQIYPRKCS